MKCTKIWAKLNGILKIMLINYLLEYTTLALNFKFEMYISHAHVGLRNESNHFIGKGIYKMPLMKKSRKMKVFWYHKWKWSLRMWVYWKNKDHTYFTVTVCKFHIHQSVEWLCEHFRNVLVSYIVAIFVVISETKCSWQRARNEY